MSELEPATLPTQSPNEAVLEPRYVGDLDEDFYVPRYQRGYRWGADDVRRLLDDVQAAGESDASRSYYLQPVVVKPRGFGEWELVDGQQRLTTLFLIFQYMRNAGLKSDGAGYHLSYETRPEVAAYLVHPDEASSVNNIDFYHIYVAYRTVQEWFENEPRRRQLRADELYGALFKRVKVIWYDAGDVNGPELFTRLNVGRIPLTDAELVKALLLSRIGATRAATDHSLETAAQWDTVESDLQDPELWAFITAGTNTSPTRISLLLDVLAEGPSGRDRPAYYTFETLRARILEDPERFWADVLDLHSLVLGWYANRDLFHRIGFLITQGQRIDSLIALSQGVPKSVFGETLEQLIRERLHLSETDLRNLTYSKGTAVNRALLLMNVETVRSREDSPDRYSFREHAVGRWSLEHIHAQNAAPLNREADWAEWLARQAQALANLQRPGQPPPEELLDAVARVLDARPIAREDFRALERELVGLLTDASSESDDETDSIANLALLQGSDNSALSNSVFAAKRDEILKRDLEGHYIPPCTRNVFLKYYSPSRDQQLAYWSTSDRRNYLERMVCLLKPYLLDDEQPT